MLRLALVLAICLPAVSPRAIAGAWETGPLDNDSAQTFLTEAVGSRDLALLRTAFTYATTDPKGFLDDEEASRALAAAELVAAMFGHAAPELPRTAQDWAMRQSKNADTAFVRLAIRAVERIAANSETRILWEEGGEKDLGAWLAGLTELRERLARAIPTR